jgi:hypothetical protein
MIESQGTIVEREQRENNGGEVRNTLFLRGEITSHCDKVPRQCPFVLKTME